MTREEFAERSAALGHAIQTGVMYEMEFNKAQGEPKHLRTGVNMALCQAAAIGKLLIEKGIVTEEEYMQACIHEQELEVKRYEERLSKKMGAKITLA